MVDSTRPKTSRSGPPSTPPQDLKALRVALAAGNRRALAKAITLVESTRAADRQRAEVLLACLPSREDTVRIGLSGPPGAGKSSLVEAWGSLLADQGRRVAVLAVDPTSHRSGGSILGDKTRMTSLARHPMAFIRATASGGLLGGVARQTRFAMMLVEAAGYDVVLVETVGVGQSEIEVAGMVDLVMLLQSPAGGDELQGIKRGIMELADIVVVTKADQDLIPAARRAAADYQAALHLLRPKWPGWTPPVRLVSALEGTGLRALWPDVETFAQTMRAAGHWSAQRRSQRLNWLHSEIREQWLERLHRNAAVAAQLPEIERAVTEGQNNPVAAARQLLALFDTSPAVD